MTSTLHYVPKHMVSHIVLRGFAIAIRTLRFGRMEMRDELAMADDLDALGDECKRAAGNIRGLALSRAPGARA